MFHISERFNHLKTRGQTAHKHEEIDKKDKSETNSNIDRKNHNIGSK